MATTCFQVALDVLESIHSKFPDLESSLLGDLKVLLGLLRTFYMCGKKWGKSVSCVSTLLSIEEVVENHSREIQSICFGSRDGEDLVTSHTELHHLHKVVSGFIVYINHSFWQEMEELYVIFIDVSLQTSSSSQEAEVKLNGIIDSLLHNLQDLLRYRDFGTDSTGPIEDLEKNVRFLKNFILFATFGGLEPGQMEDLLIHTEKLVVNAARITFLSCYYHYPVMWSNIYQVIERIKPVESHVSGIYVGVLEKASEFSLGLSQSSHHSSTAAESHGLILLGDFVDSLLGLIWELLFFRSSSIDMFNPEMQKLHEGLRFLRTILREFQTKQYHRKMFDIIGTVISEAGIIICLLFVKGNERGLNEKLELLFLDLEVKFMFIMTDEAQSSPLLMSKSYFPRTNLLGFINFVLEKVKSFMSLYRAKSISLPTKDKLQNIHKGIEDLRSFLVDAIAEGNQNEKLQDLQDLQTRIVEVIYKTEFVLDYLVIGGDVQSLAVLLNTMAEKIELINVEALETFHSKKQITQVEKENIVQTYSKMPSASVDHENPILKYEASVGLEDEAQNIIHKLKTGVSKALEIICIVGMPGLGKTTMANKVYRHAAIINHFHIRGWCSVSQENNLKILLLEILRSVNIVVHELLNMDENNLALVLYRHLKQRKYLIVLDDVWENNNVWKRLKSSFPDDNKGSKILMTSRQNIPHSKLHNLRELSEEESWDLLQKKIFSEKHSCPRELIVVGKKIAEHCQKLPLMVVIVAGILSNMKQDEDAWEEVAEDLQRGVLSIGNQGEETFELSYRHLPDYLKPCFLYLGAFQVYPHIPVQELLWLWIAEGFIEKTEGKCVEDVAEKYLMELIQRSLIKVAKKGFNGGGVKSCSIHDLVRDFCVKKGKEEHFLHCVDEDNKRIVVSSIHNSSSTLYRLRVKYSGRGDFTKSIARPLCPHLRTLFFVAEDHKTRYAQHLYDILYEFCRFKLLRVVDLRRIQVSPLFLRVIFELLVHLRYLALALDNECSPLSIPSSMAGLSYLETFIVEGRMRRVWLPETVWKMQNLRHLYIPGASVCWEFPVGNLKDDQFPNLETLSTVEFCSGQTMLEVVETFRNIRKLKCKLIIADCKILALDKMTRLKSLTLLESHHNRFHGLDFQFPEYLEKLVLSGFCLPWSKISAIGKLQHLQVLKLLKNAFKGEIWEMPEQEMFPQLKFLKLAELDLASWMASENNFQCIETLVLERCRNLKAVPSDFHDSTTLQMIEVSAGSASLTSSIQELQEYMQDFSNNIKILIHP